MLIVVQIRPFLSRFSISWMVSWFWYPLCGPQSLFDFNLRPAEIFYILMRPVYSFEFETPDLSLSFLDDLKFFKKIKLFLCLFSTLCNISWFWSLWCGPRSLFQFNLRPAGTHFFWMRPVYSFEFETPDLRVTKILRIILKKFCEFPHHVNLHYISISSSNFKSTL
jgi:hypothetical protein